MTGQLDQFSRVVAADLAALLERVAAEDGPMADPTTLPAAEGRALSNAANRRWNRDLPAMAAVHDVVVPADTQLGSADCQLKVLVPANARPGAILYCHGGGFAFGSPQTHERCARVLALESGLPVVLPDYRLAPEHPFPAGLRDCVACLRALFPATAGTGVRPGPILVAGDSAGANLAVAAMLHEQREGRPLPAGALLFYGGYDADFETPSYRYFSEGPGLTRGRMQRYWDWYAPDLASRRDPLAAPLHADDAALLALPPLYLTAAGIDPSLSDTLNLAARLNGLGRAQAVHVVPGVTHGFLQMTSGLAAARETLAGAGAAARAMTRAA
ncbi:alpha/beta hydrolase [Bosea caraganae]|uniref:Alpha/beta hydrolase n=1 Tax=Bosea caraganae TaxID=2763117 RepID=A0A370LCP2_9HYPH|nr:alpha/beta hydrolase [Bosea caraganae]RDJ27721.1 alpha/beta hydrolase [Bosea caraganae]RDJ29734.1 alpha/beta hydrolase [Bosea caraganae]